MMETAHVGRIIENDIENLPVGRDMRILCTTCHDIHQNVQSSKLLREPIVDLCGACHEDKLGVQDSVHDPGASEWTKELGFVSIGSCIDCHPVHGPAREGGIWGSIKSEDTSAQLCETCHRTGAPGKAMETPHMEKTLANNSEILPENLVVGDNGRILCTTCHDIHQKEQNSKLLRAPRRNSGVCLDCHSEFSGLFDTSHDLRISAPDEQNIRDEIAAESGPCGSCHLVHRTSGTSEVWARGSISRSDFGSSLCTCCHRQGQCASTLVPEHVDHPEVALVNRISLQQPGYMPTFDSGGERSRTGAISCLTCHDPHMAPLTSEARRKPSPSHRHKFLRPTEHQGFCADCHGMEALWRFLYYHKERRNPYTERNKNPLSPRKE
jgi:predicted CXXCH cytochrome family protein